jgi:hypothetical protein
VSACVCAYVMEVEVACVHSWLISADPNQ